jgi:hypothetical protein
MMDEIVGVSRVSCGADIYQGCMGCHGNTAQQQADYHCNQMLAFHLSSSLLKMIAEIGLALSKNEKASKDIGNILWRLMVQILGQLVP